MKNKKIIVCIFLIVIMILEIIFIGLKEEHEILKSENGKEKNANETISMMYETNDGMYEASKNNSWPTSGYRFNETLSKCEHGGELKYDEEKNVVYMISEKNDRCYVYFDQINLGSVCKNQNMANCFKDNYEIDNDIVLHNAELSGSLNDGSYRYSGATPNNYVCFGSNAENCPIGNLYRIIGVFDDRIKLIKYDAATTKDLGTNGNYHSTESYENSYYLGNLKEFDFYYRNQYNDEVYEKYNNYFEWSESDLNKINLNINFLNNIGVDWADKIDYNDWVVGGFNYADSNNVLSAYQNEIYEYELGANSIKNKIYNAKIGLIYLSDYYYSLDKNYWNAYVGTNYNYVVSKNWMYIGLDEMIISPVAGTTDHIITIILNGNLMYDNPDIAYTLRPTFYLTSDIILSGGKGTKSNPYRIA